MIPETHQHAPAYPVPSHFDESGNFVDPVSGLSKLEWFAGLALQGLAAARPENTDSPVDPALLAQQALQLAEGLIDALNERAERINTRITERNTDQTEHWSAEDKLLLGLENQWRVRIDADQDPDSPEMQALKNQADKLYR